MSIGRRNRTIGTIGLVVLSGLAFALASGCNQSQAAPAASKDAPAQVSGSTASKDQYDVAMKLDGTCTSGKECKVVISLKSKGDFHINDKYPIKFKAPEKDKLPEGLSFTKDVVKKDDGKFAEKEGTLPIGFTASKAGKVKVSGNFSFSVCSDANCVMDKVDLDLDVDVK